MAAEETLLALAQKFLFSDIGKKLIGDSIDIESYKDQINRELQAKLERLRSGEALEEEITKRTETTREERRQDRQSKRDEKKAARAQNRIARQAAREERRKAEKERGGRVGQFIPEFREFDIKGRIYDKSSGDPVEGVKVTSIINEGDIYLPFGGETTTKTDGTFIHNIKIPILPYNNKPLVKPIFVYTKSGYLPETQEVLTLDREVKSDLGIKPMIDLQNATEEDLPGYVKEANDKIREANDFLLSLPEKGLIQRRKSIMKVVRVIQTRLLPLAITLLLAFGISKLSQKNQKVCPSAARLRANIVQRNSIVRQLNQIFITIGWHTSIALILSAVAEQLKTAALTIDNAPLPLIGATYDLTAKLDNTRQVLKDLEEQNKDLNKQITVALIFLVSSLAIILILLKTLDELTQECATEEDLNLEAINEELLNLTEENTEEGVKSVQRINGFTLEIQTLDDNSVGKIKRRQAIGKNSQGVIQVKGDPSFSSSDQILLNELAFYIESNNLKAY